MIRNVAQSSLLRLATKTTTSSRLTRVAQGRKRVVQRREWIWILAILMIAALAHGINMFHFPYYATDEGTYVSQAWAVINQGKLAPYTYRYDHAPLGWIQIAIWSKLTGGFHTFGTAVDSGRALMLLIQVASTFVLYRIARNISGSILVATIVSLVFALSAYGIYSHRRVLLDNIATFWMLLSILPLTSGTLTLKRTWFSALALAISILSKEVTIFLFPVLAYPVFYRSHKSHRWFAMFGWSAIISSTVSLYVLAAALKGELFPTGTLLGGTSSHVSLLGTLQLQASRGKDGGIFDLTSVFWRQTQIWAQEEPLLVIGGSVAALLAVLTIKQHRVVGIMGAATILLWAFMARGGLVLNFYLIPLLPLLALNVGLVGHSGANRLKESLDRYAPRPAATVGKGFGLVALGICLMASIVPGYLGPQLGLQNNVTDPTLSTLRHQTQNSTYSLWTNTEADAQKRALDWVQRNLSTQDRIITETSIWTDLHDPPNGEDSYRAAHAYWQVDLDPEIREGVFHNDWRYVDYIVSIEGLERDIRLENLKLVSEAIKHSTPIVSFDTGGHKVTIARVCSAGPPNCQQKDID